MYAFSVNLSAALLYLTTLCAASSGGWLADFLLRPFGEDFWLVLISALSCSAVLALLGCILAITGLSRRQQARWNTMALLILPLAGFLHFLVDNYGCPTFL